MSCRLASNFQKRLLNSFLRAICISWKHFSSLGRVGPSADPKNQSEFGCEQNMIVIYGSEKVKPCSLGVGDKM